MTAAQSPTRNERRTMRGSRAPKACAASGCHGGHRPHAEHEAEEQDQMRESDSRDGAVAEPADERKVGGHHGDLAELGQRDRPGELHRLDDLGPPDRALLSAPWML